MTLHARILALDDGSRTPRQIAELVGCQTDYVRACRHRRRIHPKWGSVGREPRLMPDEVEVILRMVPKVGVALTAAELDRSEQIITQRSVIYGVRAPRSPNRRRKRRPPCARIKREAAAFIEWRRENGFQ